MRKLDLSKKNGKNYIVQDNKLYRRVEIKRK